MEVTAIIVILFLKRGTKVFFLLLFLKYFYMYDIFHKKKFLLKTKGMSHAKICIINVSLIPKFIQESVPVRCIFLP